MHLENFMVQFLFHYVALNTEWTGGGSVFHEVATSGHLQPVSQLPEVVGRHPATTTVDHVVYGGLDEDWL